MKYLVAIVIIIFGVSVVLCALNWGINSVECIMEKGIDNQECFEYLILQSPLVKPAMDIAEACEESDEECLKEIGKQAITKKIQNSAKNYPKDINQEEK